MQRALLDQHRGNRATAAIQPALDHRTLGGTVRIGLQVEQFGLQQDGFLELVEAGLLQRGDQHVLRLAAHVLHDDLVAEQLGAHPRGVGAGLVDLVDRHDDRHVRRLGVADRLDGLRHHAVIGGNHQHDDVGNGRTARTHGGERLMARGVDEGDRGAGGQLHLIGADMLGDAAGLAAGHIGGAQRIQQAGLAVIDMTHDGDHRGARLQVGVGIDRAFQAAFHIALGHPLGAVAEFLDHQFGGVGVDQLARRGHDAELHQRLDHVRRAGRHTVGEFLNGDGVG